MAIGYRENLNSHSLSPLPYRFFRDDSSSANSELGWSGLVEFGNVAFVLQ
jgi:hypothetical protein